MLASSHDDSTVRVLLLGIGNTLLTDDGVGIHAVRLLEEAAAEHGIDVKEAEIAGFALLDLLSGYDALVVVDAVRVSDHSPGDVVVIDEESMPPSLHLVAAHQIDLPTAIELGRQVGIPMPARVTVVGVQIEDDTTFCEEPTPAVAQATEKAARLALELAVGYASEQ